MAKVYPGVVNWNERLSIADEDVELPTPEEMGISQWVPPPPLPGASPALEPDSDTEVEDNDPDYEPE